jgi:hypothetical protein
MSTNMTEILTRRLLVALPINQMPMNTKKMAIFAGQGEAAYSTIAAAQGSKKYASLRTTMVPNAVISITATQTKTAR